ncbi:MAG: iron-containing alcohol dehydrogenase [Marinibacterium sp.]|nr:iron-containing alcohol dehydrogenase [Marinibacterium sp.]
MFSKTPIAYGLRVVSTLFPVQKPLLFSGAGSLGKLVDYMTEGGYRRPLLVTDAFLLQNGMLDGLLAQLRDLGCEVTVFDGIIPNPTFAVVEAGLAQSRAGNCDAVLAVGGGSAIDAAKVIAAAHTDARPLAKLVGNLKIKVPPLPFFVAPTTSGTGSETTVAAVISDTQTHKKRFFVSPKLVPIAAALDPELLKSLPAAMTAAVGMDAFTHAIEAYTSRNTFDDTDRDARMAIALLGKYLPVVVADGNNLEAREKVALASFLAGYAFTKASLGYVHAISHQISAQYNTPHGLANAIILPRVLRFNKPAVADRLAALERMFDPQASGSDDALATAFIARVDALQDQIGIPDRLEDLQPADYDKITADALAEARVTYAVPRVMKKPDVQRILEATARGERDLSFT